MKKAGCKITMLTETFTRLLTDVISALLNTFIRETENVLLATYNS